VRNRRVKRFSVAPDPLQMGKAEFEGTHAAGPRFKGGGDLMMAPRLPQTLQMKLASTSEVGHHPATDRRLSAAA
jgi:hypothetical protein